MSTKATTKPAPQTLSASDKQDALIALRAVSEAFTRLSGAVVAMERAGTGHDIEPAGLFGVLAMGAEDAVRVGLDSVQMLERLLGISIAMTPQEHGSAADPFNDAYLLVKMVTKANASVAANKARAS